MLLEMRKPKCSFSGTKYLTGTVMGFTSLPHMTPPHRLDSGLIVMLTASKSPGECANEAAQVKAIMNDPLAATSVSKE